MQKSDDIMDVFESVCTKSELISKLLNKVDFDIQDLENVADIYKERECEIENLNILIQSDFGKEFVSNNLDTFSSKMKEVIALEAENVEKLKIRTEEAGEKVRNLYKQKSVLIYSK